MGADASGAPTACVGGWSRWRPSPPAAAMSSSRSCATGRCGISTATLPRHRSRDRRALVSGDGRGGAGRRRAARNDLDGAGSSRRCAASRRRRHRHRRGPAAGARGRASTGDRVALPPRCTACCTCSATTTSATRGRWNAWSGACAAGEVWRDPRWRCSCSPAATVYVGTVETAFTTRDAPVAAPGRGTPGPARPARVPGRSPAPVRACPRPCRACSSLRWRPLAMVGNQRPATRHRSRWWRSCSWRSCSFAGTCSRRPSSGANPERVLEALLPSLQVAGGPAAAAHPAAHPAAAPGAPGERDSRGANGGVSPGARATAGTPTAGRRSRSRRSGSSCSRSSSSARPWCAR